MEIREYIEQNFDRFVEEWGSLIEIPSISAKPEHKADMVRCAERWKELLLAAGADRRISSIEEVLHINQHVKVRVLEIDLDRKRISLTMKN